MAEDQGKEEEKFDFTSEGEGYISLAEARVLAVRTAVETPGDYGRNFRRLTMVFEVVESGEDDDYYNITLSFRPQGNFDGTPGQEQFVVGKEGTIAVRQVLSFPTQTSGSGSGAGRAGGVPTWLLFGGLGAVVIAVIAVVAFMALRPSPTTGVGGGPGAVQVAIPADTPEPTAIP